MHLRVSLLLGLTLSALVILCQANPWERFNEFSDNTETDIDNKADDKVRVRDILEYSDFENDDDDDDDHDSNALMNMTGFNEENLNSVTHLHRQRGEILVPCFGMWWPVGGASYDYAGDYYGDYKKRRRRTRKQKKVAKMKKKKS